MQYTKISWDDFEKDCLELSKKIGPHSFDKIIAISRGGLVAARIFSDLLSIPISHMTISSYQDFQQVNEPVITELPSNTFKGESLLIIDEVSDTGKTFKRACSYFTNLPVKTVKTLSVYTKPHTTFIPDYWQKELDSWIIFPYDVRETAEAFLKEYKTKEKAREHLLAVGFKAWEVEAVL